MLLSSAFLMLRLGPASGSFPRPLSPEEERKYVDLWLAGDIEARNVLIEHNLRLVAHIIKKYYTQADDADDLISIGTIGLIKGINTYRPENCMRLREYVDTVLTEREAEIIRLRYGLRGAKPLTQRETATLCGISRSYVSRIEKKALEKLREALGDDI